MHLAGHTEEETSGVSLHGQRTGVKENESYKIEKKNWLSGKERHKIMRWKHDKETIAGINIDNLQALSIQLPAHHNQIPRRSCLFANSCQIHAHHFH